MIFPPSLQPFQKTSFYVYDARQERYRFGTSGRLQSVQLLELQYGFSVAEKYERWIGVQISHEFSRS